MKMEDWFIIKAWWFAPTGQLSAWEPLNGYFFDTAVDAKLNKMHELENNIRDQENNSKRVTHHSLRMAYLDVRNMSNKLRFYPLRLIHGKETL